MNDEKVPKKVLAERRRQKKCRMYKQNNYNTRNIKPLTSFAPFLSISNELQQSQSQDQPQDQPYQQVSTYSSSK